MGRRKLGTVEKLERLNARKELKQAKMSVKQENNGPMLSQIKTEIEGVLTKSKRGRKAKSKIEDNNTGIEVITPLANIEPDFFSMIKSGKDKSAQMSVIKNVNINSSEITVVLSKSNLPWIEKYRPKNVNDIILDDCLKNKINNLIEMNMLPNIIITGSSGTGKTSTIYCLVKQILGPKYNEALLELNASDNRGLEIINNSIIHFCKKRINDQTDSVDGIKKIIIFDEADNITNKAQNVLANMMEEYGSTTKFCFTCNDSSKIIESIQSRCLILYYRPMNKDNIKKRLEFICKTEGVEYDDNGMESIIFISQGDIRQAINNLEATHNSYGSITEKNVYKLCYQPHPNTIIALIQKCASKNLKQAIEKYEDLKEQGYCNSDILQTMINVLKLITIDEHIRINFIKILSDSYLSVNDGIDSNLQMFCCISKMINYIYEFQQNELLKLF